MREFAAGKLHSGSKSGPPVRSKAQALAIGFSEQRKAAGKPTPRKRGGSPIGRAIGKAMEPDTDDMPMRPAMKPKMPMRGGY